MGGGVGGKDLCEPMEMEEERRRRRPQQLVFYRIEGEMWEGGGERKGEDEEVKICS